MKQIRNSIYFFVLITVLFLISCNESATTSERNDKDTTSMTTNRDTSTMPPYDPAMEPLTVAAQFSKKLGDTLDIKMYEVTLKPGDSMAVHNHPDHLWYVVQGGKLALTFNGGARQVVDVSSGMGQISGPLSDVAVNVGNTTLKLLVADIYRPRGR